MQQFDMLGRPITPPATQFDQLGRSVSPTQPLHPQFQQQEVTNKPLFTQPEHKTYYEPFDMNKVNFDNQSAVWSEAGHETKDSFHQPCVALEQLIDNNNGTFTSQLNDFVSKPGYDNFRSQFPNQHRTKDDFGNRNLNKLDLGLLSMK